MRPFDEWAEARGVTMTAEPTTHNPRMADSGAMDHWRCTITSGEASHALTFSQGHGHRVWRSPMKPELGDVLCCLASDARSVDETLCFADWAEDLGFDADSISARDTYLAVQEQAAALAKLLGGSLFSELLELEEDGPYIERDELEARFEAEILPHLPDDYPARREAWNNWCDGLCKDGEMPEWQYDTEPGLPDRWDA